MRMRWAAWLWWLAAAIPAAAGDGGNRLTWLDDPCNPYYVGLNAPKLVTPQWVGQEGVEAVLVLSIDDMRSTAPYEKCLRPIIERLKRIDGRGPVSIMTSQADPVDPLLAQWPAEGVTVEAHTATHPCPCLQGSDLAKAKQTYDDAIDLLTRVPGGPALAFRMPCCDSMNSVGPRFFTELFGKTTAFGHFLRVDSSVFMVFTPDDPALPRTLTTDEEGQPRFAKYIPRDRNFVNYVENYPYPFVIDHKCWEMPSQIPDDWLGINLQGNHNPLTVRDMKAAIDAVVLKQGAYTLTFHPDRWIRNDQVIELIDHATGRYGGKVKFLNFREIHALLTQNLLGGQPLRADDGSDNGVRVLDLNADGYMDVVIGNDQVRQTRLWSPETRSWTIGEFPVQIVRRAADGETTLTGVRFGVLQQNGCASILVRNEDTSGLWHFDGRGWTAAARGLDGLDLDGPVWTARAGSDQGVRLHDLDLDGVCELVVGNPRQNGVWRWSADGGGWSRLPFGLPAGTAVVDSAGRDAGLRLVDIDEDGHDDIVFSDARRYSLHLFTSLADGWSRKIHDTDRERGDAIPPIVREDGTNNGVWFQYRHLYVQNEDTGNRLPNHIDARSYTQLLVDDVEPPARAPESALHSLVPRPGFRVELMAAEPLVRDCIDIQWGPDGKAWVAEMTDYPLGMAPDGHVGPPEPLGQPGGRIRYLQDTDGDGRYDKSTLFLEGVAFPTGVMPWRQGVIITAAPETFYAEDSDGDGRADVHRTLLSGFHEGNQQHRVNHPRWGLDNWVHLANGDSGGEIRSAKTGEVVQISGRDLRMRPDEGLMDPQTGQTQYGRNRTDWGDWFGCNNSNAGYHFAVADHYLRRNPHVAAPPGRIDVTESRECFPAGRVITHCFIPQPTPAEGVPGHWTSIAGVTIYRDELFGPEFAGNLFVADSVYNVIHRLILSPQGTTFRGERAADEQRSEFLGSADPWFRPTTVHTGPDGALWVVDMYRFVIEHPEWIVPELTNKLELRRYSERGRIYRIYPVDRQPRPVPRLDQLNTAGLVAALDHPNGWQRDMAQQMLLWRADKSAVEPLAAMVQTSPRPLARLHALCTLEGLNALRPEIVSRGLADPHPGVRRHAVRLSEPLLDANPALGDALLQLADDADPQVQLQLLYSLGQWHDERAGRLLARLAVRQADDPYLVAAALSSAVPHVRTMIAELRRATDLPAGGAELLGQLETLAAAIRADPSVTSVADGASDRPIRAIEPDRQEVERLLGGAATVEQVRQAMAQYAPVLDLYGDPERGRKMFVEATCSTCHRFQDLGTRIGPDLETLVERSPQTLLVAVMDPNRACIDRYVEHVALSKQGVVHVGMLLEETSNSLTLVDVGGKQHVVLRKDLEELVFTGRSHMPEGLYGKLNHQQMADLFAFLGGREPPPRQLAGNRPQAIVRGPDTAFSLPASAAAIYGDDVDFDSRAGCVTAWTSPNAYAAWPLCNFVMQSAYDVWIEYACDDAAAGNRFAIQVNNGQSVAGTTSGTGGWDQYRAVHLGQVAMAAGNYRLSVRPEEPLAGPLMNLRSVKLVPAGPAPPPGAFRNAPETVKQGEDGAVQLSVTKVEVHGPGVIFEPRYGNLGCWYGPEGFGCWRFEVRQGGTFDVRLDWACQDSTAGNPFHVVLDDQVVVQGEVPGTGTWDDYRQQKFGQLQLAPGAHRLEFRSAGAIKNALLDLRTVMLVPAKD